MFKSGSDRFVLINELVTYLNQPNLSYQDLTRYLTLKTFSDCSAHAVYIMLLDKDATLELLDSFGQTQEEKTGWRTIPLSHDVPAADD